MIYFNGAGVRALLAVVLFGLATPGCAIIPKPTESARVGHADALGECADFFSSLDRRTSKARVIDPGAFRVEGYPYLRVNRFLESFRKDAGDEAEFSAWVNRMQALDRHTRSLEIDNLPRGEGLSPDGEAKTALIGRVDTCGSLLKMADFADTSKREGLRKTVSAPNDYSLAARIFGVYPVSSLFVSRGVTKWHAEARATFTNAPPTGWRAVTYVPRVLGRAADVEHIVSGSKRDALGIPDYSDSDRDALFTAYAPIWQIRTEGPYDRIGAPFWSGEGELSVNIEQPVVYTLLSFTRFGRPVLTQLNYIIWFPARPKEGLLDMYGGFLDGVNYRVTLDPQGKPLVYETIHNCGCYYEAYPTQRLKVRDSIDYPEPPLILSAPDPREGDVMTLALESRTHYVQHVYASSRGEQGEAVPYTFTSYDELRSLPDARGGYKSMFAEDSIAHGSERLERFILWPTGVFSPGAMRQWGRHSVAFVGERHFDDPHALENMFTVSASD